MKIRVTNVTQTQGGLHVTLAHPLYAGPTAASGYSPEAHRLLRVIYMHARTGYRADGSTRTFQMGWEARQANAINTRAALQAELDRYANTPVRLQFSQTRIYAAGHQPSNPATIREVQEARKRGCQIQPSFWITGSLPLTHQDNDRLAAALAEANIPGGVYGPHTAKEGCPLAVTIYMAHRPQQDLRDPWVLARSAQAIANRVIV